MKVKVDLLIQRAASFSEVTIHSHSIAAIFALNLPKEYLISQSLAPSYFWIKLACVPGHSEITGNCKSYELTKKGIAKSLSLEWKCVGAPLSFVGLPLDSWTWQELGERWVTSATWAVTRSFWPKVNRTFKLCSIVRVMKEFCPVPIAKDVWRKMS